MIGKMGMMWQWKL